ncbi:hypothetical protein K437DRAFT_270353 [Tilletiaria anomala UBC 951]|uniref:Large ribosomal subunit protein mL59 domain-containing protein n=1 Tax=Tilletiaria anomala (strain ATCC 24038 / CBS 436.72 / UBC 951) TaxID=1037660 RepID=A0A066VBY0_TILAU|nr:uncharacterized protein K437DRAFT_270353 [Tilletiaria anomala UBC 951]KDN39252.1 hypothetical protein K437DRAFT_270353 [Tilletiaria anomala UBC 951]
MTSNMLMRGACTCGTLRTGPSAAIRSSVSAPICRTLQTITAAEPGLATSQSPKLNQTSKGSSPSTPAPSAASQNLFQRWRNPATGKWRPPQYSLRAQAQIASAALQMGTIDELPRSPKVAKFIARARANARALQAPASTSAGTAQGAMAMEYNLGADAATDAAAGASSADAEALNAALRGWHLSSEQDSAMAKAIVHSMRNRGPYAGRKGKMFKGTKSERGAKAKAAKIDDKLQAMSKTVAEWRQSKLAAKAKHRPSLPF